MNEANYKKFQEFVIIAGFLGSLFLVFFMVVVTFLTFKGEFPVFLAILLWSVVIYAGCGIYKIIKRDYAD